MLYSYKKCQILALPEKYQLQPFGFAFQKDSPYLDIFNFYINNLRESGALTRIFKDVEPAPQDCPKMEGTSLGFNNCFGAFLVMIVGVGTGILLLIAEAFVKHNIQPLFQTQSDNKDVDQRDGQAEPVEINPRTLPQQIEVSIMEIQ